jgi:hypothetical protein
MYSKKICLLYKRRGRVVDVFWSTAQYYPIRKVYNILVRQGGVPILNRCTSVLCSIIFWHCACRSSLDERKGAEECECRPGVRPTATRGIRRESAASCSSLVSNYAGSTYRRHSWNRSPLLSTKTKKKGHK